MVERRAHPRRRTLLGGRIEIAKLNGWAADCAVRDLSAIGARIRIPSETVVPPTFELSVSGDAPVGVRLVWYHGGEAGVALASLR